MGKQLTHPDRLGVEARIVELDVRIAALDKQIAVADQQVAQAAAVPGAIVERPRETRQGPPEEAYILGMVFMALCLFPLAVAFAMRFWKRGSIAVATIPPELTERLSRLDQAVDSIAIEVERIGEGQRFMTRVMSENGRAVGAGAAAPLDVRAHEHKAVVAP